jgi:hypothetical protein
MPFITLLLGNWKLVLIGLFAAWVGWLYWDNGHLQRKVEDLSLQIATVKAENKQLTNASVAITRKYDGALVDTWAAKRKAASSEYQRIRYENAFNSISIPNSAVSVFNNGSPDNQQTTTNPIKRNDGGTVTPGTVGEADKSERGNEASGLTLADLLVAARENRLRLEMCIDVIHQWQSFWTDFVNAVNNTTPKTK